MMLPPCVLSTGSCHARHGSLLIVAQHVPFSHIGGVARIEVVGIPALRCRICGEERYDLNVLTRIESALHRRVMQGDRQTSYTFEQLAATEGQQ